MENEPPSTNEPDFKLSRRQKAGLTDPLKIDRLPPHSVESEQALLGCILLDPQVSLPKCVSKLASAEAFYDLRHRTIYENMVRMQDERLQVELISLQQELKDQKLLEGVGGLAYLASLPDATPSAANIDYYLSVLCEKHTMRRLIGLCTEVVSRAYEHEGEVEELVDQVERDMHAITTAAQSSDQMQTAKDLIKGTLAQIEQQFERKGQVNGIATGFNDFDRLTGGLQDGDLIVIAARPSMGKTSFAMNIAEHVALDLKLPVGVASLEMTRRSLMMRLVCSVARIPSNDVRDGHLQERDFSKLTTAASKLNTRNLVIDDSSGLSILQLKARARRMHQQYGIKLLIIDYLQLLHSTSKKADNRQQEVSDVSNGAKQIAKELNIPVIILAQLNREMEKNGNRKPRLSDLRESGSIEQDADVVGLLYKPTQEEEGDVPSSVLPVNLLIAKQRNGPTGEVELAFLKHFTRFESAARTNESSSPHND